jgi:hypothetical protein
MSSPKIAVSNTSKVTIDGKEVPGVQQVDFKISRNRQNIHSLSTDERIGAYFGALFVQGSLKVRSLFEDLDNKFKEKIVEVKPFQMIIELYTQGTDQLVRKITFDECYIEDKTYGMDAAGVALTTYNFTATRLSEE